MCRLLAIEFTQHLDNGNLSPLGWAVAVAYLLGAAFCIRAAMVTQQHGRRHSDEQPPWWGLVAVLLFLGINKWLDLQTLLMGLGRAVSGTAGWYQHRRAVEAVFNDDSGRSIYLLPLLDRRQTLRTVDWVKDASIVRLWPNRDG